MNSINNLNETKIKAVGYCRFSSNNQREESITAQKRFIVMFAQQYGYEIIDWYCDEAKSGKTAERPAFQKLIHDVKSDGKDFSTVIVHKLDRFSRSVADTLNYKHLFSDYGIDVVSASEKLDNSPSGNLMLTIMSGLKVMNIH